MRPPTDTRKKRLPLFTCSRIQVLRFLRNEVLMPPFGTIKLPPTESTIGLCQSLLHSLLLYCTQLKVNYTIKKISVPKSKYFRDKLSKKRLEPKE